MTDSTKTSGVLGRIAPGDQPPGPRVPVSTVDVLFVHCDPAFIASLTDALRRHAFSVYAVGSAEEALLAVAQGCSPRLVILDVAHLDPRRLLADLRRMEPCAGTRFVVLTSASGSAAAAGLPVDEMLLKPLEVRELLEVLHRHCGPA